MWQRNRALNPRAVHLNSAAFGGLGFHLLLAVGKHSRQSLRD
jgi:hypothetical protein